MTTWLTCVTKTARTAATLPSLAQRQTLSATELASTPLAQHRFLYSDELSPDERLELGTQLLHAPREGSLPLVLHVLDAAEDGAPSEGVTRVGRDVVMRGAGAIRERLGVLAEMQVSHVELQVCDAAQRSDAVRAGAACAVLCGDRAVLADLIAYARIRGYLPLPADQGLTDVA